MNASEAVSYNEQHFQELRKLVGRGEGLKLEFKRKASHPEKIVREIIAFANTEGGTLLVGVDDDGSIPGVKYPEEEILAIGQALQLYCRPALLPEHVIISVSPKTFVVRFEIPASIKRPHYFKTDQATRESFVRSNDMSVKASKEMVEIVRRKKLQKNIRFTFGDAEKTLMEYLEQKGTISLEEFRALTRLNRYLAAKKLVLLVLANVLRINPTEKGDVYSRAST